MDGLGSFLIADASSKGLDIAITISTIISITISHQNCDQTHQFPHRHHMRVSQEFRKAILVELRGLLSQVREFPGGGGVVCGGGGANV